MDPDEFDTQYATLSTRYEELTAEHEHTREHITTLKNKRTQARHIHHHLASNPDTSYSDQAWNTLVDHARVKRDGTISIIFKDDITLNS